MLRKLLKYDLAYVFRIWWIGALSSLGLSALIGICITVLNSDKRIPDIVELMAVLAIVVSVIGLVAFSILSFILVAVRFYKNFFTDEGYLTFTLPVSRISLYNSKLISAALAMLLTVITLIVDVIVLLAIGFNDVFFTEEFFDIFDVTPFGHVTGVLTMFGSVSFHIHISV